MRALSREEQTLFDEMKERCLAKGQYKDEKAKDKFKMLCHLEDFMIQYWELQKENEILKENAKNNDKVVDKITYTIKPSFTTRKLKQLQQENKQLKEQLSVTQTNEETFRLEMEDITKILGLDEDTIFDDVKSYARNLKDNMFKKEQLKKQLEDKTEDYKRMKDNFDSKVDVLTKIETQQKEFIDYLENEKDRLARECSQIYEDSLGKTRLVNEDIFDEIDNILQKYKEIIGVEDEKEN